MAPVPSKGTVSVISFVAGSTRTNASAEQAQIASSLAVNPWQSRSGSTIVAATWSVAGLIRTRFGVAVSSTSGLSGATTQTESNAMSGQSGLPSTAISASSRSARGVPASLAAGLALASGADAGADDDEHAPMSASARATGTSNGRRTSPSCRLRVSLAGGEPAKRSFSELGTSDQGRTSRSPMHAGFGTPGQCTEPEAREQLTCLWS